MSPKGCEQFPACSGCDVLIAYCQHRFDLAAYPLKFMERQIRAEALLQFKAASYVSLSEHAPEMGFHSGEADPQPVRNLLVAEPGRLKLCYLPLSPRQFVLDGRHSNPLPGRQPAIGSSPARKGTGDQARGGAAETELFGKIYYP